jgi:hypothetical protein
MNEDNFKGMWEKQSKTFESSNKTIQPLLASIEVTQQMQKLHNFKMTRIVESVIFFLYYSEFTFNLSTRKPII